MKIPKKYDNMHRIHIKKHEYELIRVRIQVINACYHLGGSVLSMMELMVSLIWNFVGVQSPFTNFA